MRYLRCFVVILPLLALAACGKPPAGPAPTAAQPAATSSGADTAAIDAALANPGRLAGDRDEDGWRKSGEMLRFLELRPGQRVLDYFAAGGFNSELMSYVVGPQGEVVAYNNPAYLKYSEKKVAERYAGNRLPNVAQLTSAPEEAPFEPQSFDAALFVLGYHDLHWKAKDGSWPATDPAKSLARLVPALKPGAVVVVVDHVANAGGDPGAVVDALHRIDPAIIRQDFESAGLVFDAESDVLRNPADDHSKLVFDESIRHQTDRVMYRFRKP